MKKIILQITFLSLLGSAVSASDIVLPEIKYSNKQVELKVNSKKVRLLEVEIRDSFDKVVYATAYYNVVNFEKIYNVGQLKKGKYFVTIVADGRVYRDMIKVKRG